MGVSENETVFLSFSRIQESTKTDYLGLINFFHTLPDKIKNERCQLWIAGNVFSQDFLNILQSKISNLGLEKRISLLPSTIYDRHLLMSASDVFLHLSVGIQETCSRVIIEAMANGLPVITSDWAGFPDIVDHGKGGFFVPTRIQDFCFQEANALFRNLPPTEYNSLVEKSVKLHYGELCRYWIYLTDHMDIRRKFSRYNINKVREFYDLESSIKHRENFMMSLEHKMAVSKEMRSKIFVDMKLIQRYLSHDQ